MLNLDGAYILTTTLPPDTALAFGSDTPAASVGGLHPLVDALAQLIRSSWQALPGLEPLTIDPDLEAITGSLDGEALYIRNELQRCRGLRKLHLETARLGAGLQILHSVFFPDPRFDLPVFGADIVAGPAGVSAAIVDLSPVTSALPGPIDSALAARARRPYAQERELPAWGGIFSPHVLFLRPTSQQEELSFLAEVREILDILCTAVERAGHQSGDDPSTLDRWHGQIRYCKQQKQNDKTRRVLEKAFNPQWANRYIEELLFDEPPTP